MVLILKPLKELQKGFNPFQPQSCIAIPLENMRKLATFPVLSEGGIRQTWAEINV